MPDATTGGDGPDRFERLVARVPGLAALVLGFAEGSATLEVGGRSVQRHGGRPVTEPHRQAVAVLDRAVRSRALPLVVESLTESGALAAVGLPASELRGAYVGVPVRSTGRVVGVLSVTDPEPRPIARQQVRVLVELARLLADQLSTGPGPGSAGPVDDARAEIEAALAAGEIRPWYQPVINLATGDLIGVEALARWHRSSGVVEGPASFLPIAERSDLVIDLDRVVMARAFHDLREWQRHRPGFRVSVNLSGRHLDRADALEQIDAAVAAAGLDPTTVDLEITETARPSGARTPLVLLTRLKDRGYTVWFDDFGSGWSALQDLIRLPVGGIKLDRSFAEQLGTPVDDAVVTAVAALAAQVGLKVTIEGIQDREQADRARRLGCHYAQGYLWSRPVPPGEVTALLSA